MEIKEENERKGKRIKEDGVGCLCCLEAVYDNLNKTPK